MDEFVKPKEGSHVLDLGCGSARILDHLPSSVSYTGLDISEEYIRDARERYGDRGIFICAAVGERELPEEDAYDLVLAVGVLHHLDDEEAGHLCEIAACGLRAGGVFFSIDPALYPGQSPIARFLISRDRGRNVRGPAEYRRIASAHFAQIEANVTEDLLRVPYTHYIMRCSNRRSVTP